MNHVMTIEPDGSIKTLWTEAIPLEEIGQLKVQRASSIEYNNLLERWEVRFPDSDEVVFHDKSRATCIAWEIETIQAQMLDGSACPITPRPPMSEDEHNAFPKGRFN